MVRRVQYLLINYIIWNEYQKIDTELVDPIFHIRNAIEKKTSLGEGLELLK